MFKCKWFSPKPSLPSVEQWAEHNSRKASADGLIASAIIESFAKDFKSWRFEGEFHQRHSSSRLFKKTTLSRKVPCKKHIEIVFLFRETNKSDAYNSIYKYQVIGCEVNGIRIEEKAFKAILTSWNNLVVQVKATEAAAEEAKRNMEAEEAKWNLAEGLLGMKRNGLGALVPVKTVEG
jgi:hypothetical protein